MSSKKKPYVTRDADGRIVVHVPWNLNDLDRWLESIERTKPDYEKLIEALKKDVEAHKRNKE